MPAFELGCIVATPAALAFLEAHSVTPLKLVLRF